ncbi:hypothetical protein [Rudanella paleaurantiibacter]|nr:hypothetical protein [Rudanella paleaurantiibacter]
MKTEQLNYLSHQHIEVRLWHEEITFVQVELPLLEKMFDLLDRQALTPEAQKQFDALKSHIAHFYRLIPRLSGDIEEYDQTVVQSWQNKQAVPAGLRRDHRYIRQEMDDFHADYTRMKRELRAFVALHESFFV